MESATMQFGFEDCSHCPVALRAIVLLFLVSLVTACVAGSLLALRARGADMVGGVLLAILLITMYLAAVQLRDGIDWRWRRISDAEIYISWTAPPVFALLCVSACACFRFAYRAVKSRISRLAA